MKTKTLLPILFVGTAVTTGVFLSRNSWNLYLLQRQKANVAIQEAKNLDKERCHLIQTRIHSESPIGQEELARQQGYRNPTEQPVETMVK